MCHLLVIDESEFMLRQAVLHYYETKEPFYLPVDLEAGEDVFLATKNGIIAYAETLFSEYTTRPADPHWQVESDGLERTYACLDLISVDLRHPLLGISLSELSLETGAVPSNMRQRLLEAWQYGYFESDVSTIEEAKQRRDEKFRERNHLGRLASACERCGQTERSILEWHEQETGFTTLCPSCHRLAHQSFHPIKDVAATSDES
ncbi:hypothetical protein [Exiguobacterium sp. s193]|uniref:hypothetical protein n=1 Tax=Exiguobacterium sp. s193 TaxID=2751207 RepID=UPI001BEC0863